MKKKQKLQTFYNFQTTIHHLECYNLLSLVSILSTHVHIQHIHMCSYTCIYLLYIFTQILRHICTNTSRYQYPIISFHIVFIVIGMSVCVCVCERE